MEPVKRVLLIDDSQDILQTMGFFLEVSGYVVTCAENGKVALEHLAEVTDLPDLIILDMMMPEMDGFAFRREQLKDPRLAGIPVIVATALSENALSSMGPEEFPRVLKKPIEVDDLLRLIAEVGAGDGRGGSS